MRVRSSHVSFNAEVRAAAPVPAASSKARTAKTRRTRAAHVPALERHGNPYDLRLVRLPGARCDMILPGGDWRAYLERLEASGVFADRPEILAQLQAMEAKPGPVVGPETPRVGVMISELEHLLPEARKGDGRAEALACIYDAALVEGCHPVLIPPCLDLLFADKKKGTASLLAQLDARVGPGGSDIDPKIYGQHTTWAVNTNYARDLFERQLVAQSLHAPLFSFDICRSLQLHGELYQDIEKERLVSVTHVQTRVGLNRRVPYRHGDFVHRVYFKAGSRMAEIIGRRSAVTNSLHHQALRQAPPGFKVVGVVYDPDTGHRVIEAMERWNGFATQFHPEILEARWAKRLFGTVMRRAHVVRQLKRLQASGEAVTVRSLLRRVEDQLGARLLEADRRWLRQDLGQRLRSLVR